MVKVELKYNYGSFEKGEVIQVENNEAHALIEAGVAKLYQPTVNRMMDAGPSKKYRTK